jgi:hypothetical protein
MMIAKLIEKKEKKDNNKNKNRKCTITKLTTTK